MQDAITDLQNPAGRMDYATARQQGRPVGSGGVEANSKSLVSVRMTRPGFRWKEPTGERITLLRPLLDLAGAHGCLTLAEIPKEIPAAELRTLDPQERRWGGRLAYLISTGRISAAELEQLGAHCDLEEDKGPLGSGVAQYWQWQVY